MRRTILILFCVLPLLNWAQESTETQTDSSVIRTKYLTDINSIRVFNELNFKFISYYTEYYLDTKKIKKEGMYDHGYPTGLWKEYSQDGKVTVETNYNDSIWCLQNRSNFKFFDLQFKMKEIADSIIISTYSQDFFNKHIEWNPMQSSMNNGREYRRWNEKINKRPTKFSFYYDFRIDQKHIYKNMIRIVLDSLGSFIPSDASYDPQGFEKLPTNIEKTFKLNTDSAFKIAQDNGLIENDTLKATTLIKWESSNKPEFYNINYKFYIIQKYKSERIEGKGHLLYILNNYYYVWTFNPWTGEFVEKKKMISTFEAEQGHGRSSGLQDLK